MTGQQISDGSGHGWAHVECFISQRNGDRAVQDREQLKPQVYYCYGEVGHDPPVHMVDGSWIGPKEVRRSQSANRSLCGKQLSRFRGRPADTDLICGSCRRIARGDSGVFPDDLAAQMDELASVSDQDYEIQILPLGALVVDRADGLQRTEQTAWSKKIGTSFSWAVFNRRPPMVSARDDGTYHVMDGQHAVAGARVAGYGPETRVRCHVWRNLTRAQEASMFRQTNADRKSVKPLDLFRARLAEGDPQAVAIEAVLRSHGWQLGSAGKAGNFAAVKTIENIWGQKDGPEACGKILATIADAWGTDPDAVHQAVLKVLSLFFRKYPQADVARLAHVLRREPELQPVRIHGWTHERAWQEVAVVRLRERYDNRLDPNRRLEP